MILGGEGSFSAPEKTGRPMKNKSTRRTFLSRCARGVAASAAAPAMLTGQAADAPPNVIFITSDQMRGDALGFLGSRNARTPNLDRMAKEGVAVVNCFANGPVCVPTRKSCFSGQYPHVHGSPTNVERPLLSWPGSLLEHFQKRGYRTGWVGKNHTFEKSELASLDFASIRDREPFRAYNSYVPPHWHTDVYWPEEKCYPQVNSDAAAGFIRDHRNGDPFFLHVSYFDPHPPYMAPARYTSRYRSSEMKLPVYVPPERLSSRLADYHRAAGFDRITRQDLTETMRYYYAQIEWGVDEQVGRLLRLLEDQGLSQRTIVMFTADHGDFMGTHGMVRKGPFLYDALLHVPMIWHAPGRIARGHRTEALAQSIDIFPTLADLSGGTPPGRLPGRSLAPFLRAEREDDPDRVIFTSSGYSELEEDKLVRSTERKDAGALPLHTQVLRQTAWAEHKMSMARSRDWKLIRNQTRPPELYQMNGGWVERENVAGKSEFASVRRQLETQLSAWWEW